jgi:hypothetical protein
MNLESLLITPVQRIPRYNLLLQVRQLSPPFVAACDALRVIVHSVHHVQDLIKNTDATHPDYDDLCKALALMKDVSQHINERCAPPHIHVALLSLRPQPSQS